MDYDYEPDLDEMSEVETDPVTKYPILQRLDIIPAILITSEFKKDSPGAEIINAPWQVVFLTSNDNDDFCALFQTSFRSALNKSSDDEIVPSRKELPVVRCIPQRDCPEELAMDGIANCFEKVIGSLLMRNGILFINDIPDSYYTILPRILKKHNKKQSVFLLGKATNPSAKYLVENDFAQELQANCPELWKEYTEQVLYQDSESCIHLHISSGIIPVSSNDTFKISQFGELLTIEGAGFNPPIEQGDLPDDFRNFLKHSVGGTPSWYCYNPKNGYHLQRAVEKEILLELDDAMEAADRYGDGKEAKPLLLTGQAYSGKTNILCSIAWQMFAKSQYPVIYMWNSYFSADYSDIADSLDFFLERLETLEYQSNGIVVPTLIVWDSSCRQTGDLLIPVKLLRSLRKKGRQVQMICSSYPCPESALSSTKKHLNGEGDVALYRDHYRRVFNVNEKLEDSEKESLKGILQQKGGFTNDEINSCFSKFGNNPHFIATLYRFGELHDEIVIQKHLVNEMEGANFDFDIIFNQILEREKQRNFLDTQWMMGLDKVKGAFNLVSDQEENDSESKKENSVFWKQMQQLMDCLAFCTFYGCAIPVSLVLRLLDTEFHSSSDIYLAFLNHSMLREQFNSGGDDLQLCLRSPLEAEIMLKAAKNRNGTDYCIDLLLLLLDKANLSEKLEIDLLRKLIQSIGPNCKMLEREKYCLWDKQQDRFPEIWGKIRSLRKGSPISLATKLLPQELSLIREYYNNNMKENEQEKHKALLEAQETAQNALSSLPMSDNILKANIIVEYCNISRILISNETNDSKRLFQQEKLYKEYGDVLFRTGKENNDSYAQTTLLKIGLEYYDSLCNSVGNDSDKSIDLLADLYSYCSGCETKDDECLILEVNKIYNKIDLFNCNDELFKRRIAANDPTPLFLKVIQEKRKIDTVPDTGIERDRTVMQLAGDMLNDFLQNKHFEMIVKRDPRLIGLLVRMLWMSKTGWDIIPKSGEERLHPVLSKEEWEEIYETCLTYNQLVNDEIGKKDWDITYLQALAALTLRNYKDALSLLHDKCLFKHVFRRGNWYLICDETGSPRTFRGVVDYKDKDKRYGFLCKVKATDGQDHEVLNKVSFKPENLGWTQNDCIKTKVTPCFWISVSFSGTEVVRIKDVEIGL